jgi:tetratricopeptide (TPR) repeat protein
MQTALLARQASPEELRKLETIYANLVAKYPRNAVVKNGQGELFWNLGERSRARDAWLAAEEIDPRNAEVLDHLGGSFLDTGETRQAAGYYARATANAPDNATYHFNYANFSFLFRHELLSPKNPDASAVLREALGHFAEASRLEPRNIEYARAYAETFYTVPDADWGVALRAWQHFYEISPNKDFALINLARVHLKLGDTPAARDSLKRIQGAEFSRLKTRLEQQMEVK